MNDYFWLLPYYQHITTQHSLDRQHHALLLQSINGNGVETLIEQLIALTLCTDVKNNQPCQKCRACHLLQAQTHPDFYRLTAEKKSIGVDEVRRVLAKLYESAQQGHNKVVWIEQAESLTEAAANALLKTLEEPPKNTFFILNCQMIAKISATIKSRCIHYFIAPPSLQQSYQWLEEQTPSKTQAQRISALKLSQQAPVAAQQLLTDSIWQEREQFYQAFLIQLAENNCFALLDKLKNTSLIDYLLFWLSTLFCDAIKYQLQTTSFIMNRDQAKIIHVLANTFNGEQLNWLYQQAQHYYEQDINQNTSRELLIATFLSDIDQMCINQSITTQ